MTTPGSDRRMSPADVLGHVNPFVGVDGEGHTFPGAALPFGMVQWSPDTTAEPGGYRSAHDAIRGFSLTHISGAGCPAYQDVPLLPALRPPVAPPRLGGEGSTARFSHERETAEPGFYAVRLDAPDVDVELAVATRSGLACLRYPAVPEATLLINTWGSAAGNSRATIEIHEDGTVRGVVTSGGFCGAANQYTLYFALAFDRDISGFGVWDDASVHPGSRSVDAPEAGAYVVFDATKEQVLQVKIGISFVGVENAIQNMATEIPAWDFAEVRERAADTWKHWLGRIEVEGGTNEELGGFYTALYHALLHPNVFSDVDGRYVGFDGQIRHAEGYTHYANFSGWDIYRTQMQLLALIAPRETAAMLQSMVVDAREGGWLPRWSLANGETGVMVGDPAVPIIASCYALGIHDFDARTALEFMLRSATEPVPGPLRYPSLGPQGHAPRPGLAEFLVSGYVPIDTRDGFVWGPAATTLEYAIADFCLSRFAAALGEQTAADAYMRRAQCWQLLFNPANNLIQPRRSDGVFLPEFDSTPAPPRDVAGHVGFVEGSAQQYTWMVPHNQAGLFAALGGDERVIERLDTFFTELNAGEWSPYAWIGNEPSLSAPWAYTFTGVPERTDELVRRVCDELYSLDYAGLPGNDDLGTMSAWYVWASIGLYPAIPGVAGFVASSPRFRAITLHHGDGQRLRITARRSSSADLYVERLTVDGQAYQSTWLPAETFQGKDTTLEFELADRPNPLRGRALDARPPSFREWEAPVLAYAEPSGSIHVKSGESSGLQVGIRNLRNNALDVQWTTSAPDEIHLVPSTGTIGVAALDAVKQPMEVTVASHMPTGVYLIEFSLQAPGLGDGSVGAIPSVVVEVVVE